MTKILKKKFENVRQEYTQHPTHPTPRNTDIFSKIKSLSPPHAPPLVSRDLSVLKFLKLTNYTGLGIL